MRKPDVSIIVPVYNAEEFIGAMIASVRGQTLENWELIRSTTVPMTSRKRSSAPTRKRTAGSTSSASPTAGPSAARNLGISKAAAEWIAFIDADDTVTPDYLEKLMLPVSENSTIDLVSAGYYEQNRYKPEGIPLHDFQSYFPTTVITEKQFLENIFNGVTGVLWAKLFRSSIIMSNSLALNPGLKLSEDLLFVLQYVKKCQIVALVPEAVYFYNRIQESGLSSKLDISYISGIRKFNELILAEYSGSEKSEVAAVLKRKPRCWHWVS
ncbi:glycosyltransferase family 2 protein [Kaistella anthropi]|nr:glycosyltransferase family 2 protein [Kaistella anthropi]